MPTPNMFATYGPMFLMIGVAFTLATLFFIGASLGTKKPTLEKNMPFECGNDSTGGRHVKMSVKFYMTAILFVVFDIETVFIYPWAVKFDALGMTGFVSMVGFLVSIVVALVYVLKKGGLEWEK